MSMESLYSDEKVKEFLTLLQNPNVQSFLKLFFDSNMATSDLRVLKRLSKIESMLGLNELEEEDKEPTIPEQISLLSEKIKTISEPITASIREPVNIPTSKTEIRACALVGHLKDTGKDHLTTPEILHFLKCKLPENCRIDDSIQNIRKVKQDVLNKAASMYSNVFLSKKKTGHKEVRLVVRNLS